MPRFPHRGVPGQERGVRASLLSSIDWEELHVFAQVAADGSFRAAADRLGVAVNKLRRQVTNLEAHLGHSLLTRHVDGVRPTAEGFEVIRIAREMERAAVMLERIQLGEAAEVSGTVQVAVTEGLGAFWLAPRLVEFQRAYPSTLVELVCAMESADVLRLQADLAIQIADPAQLDVKRLKLGRLHTMPFASRSYVDLFGLPARLSDVPGRHRLVLQVAEQTQAEDALAHLLPGVPPVGLVAFRSNTASACLWAIATGAGIGFAPTYIPVIGGKLIPVDCDGIRFSFDIWLTFHPAVGDLPRVRRLIDWLVDAFDPQRFPWFRDEFIHPQDLAKSSAHASRSIDLFSALCGGS